ncbi:transposase [Actinoplanes sp. NPDC089786]|uniref:IS66 family transposase n=1 Tax=Actinoplanes sp. NPDC089786 TaxID=3155185 RepID=UPI003417C10F
MRRLLQTWRDGTVNPTAVIAVAPKPREVTGWSIRPAAERTGQEQADLNRILQRCDSLHIVDRLVSDFAGMLHQLRGPHPPARLNERRRVGEQIRSPSSTPESPDQMRRRLPVRRDRPTGYHIDEHGRSVASMTAFGILPRFTGVAVHDAYSGYDGFAAATHALCNARILFSGNRDRRVRPTSPRGRLGRGPREPARRRPPLGRPPAHSRPHGAAAVQARRPVHPLRPSRRTASEHSSTPPWQATPARNPALRLRDRKPEFLRFATVAFSNNVAERAVRMIKSKTRVSGGFRTLTGAQTFLAIRGYISTIRKNGSRTTSRTPRQPMDAPDDRVT